MLSSWHIPPRPAVAHRRDNTFVDELPICANISHVARFGAIWRDWARFGAIWRGWSLRVEALCLPCLHESEDRLREKARDKEWLHVAKPHPFEGHGTDVVRVSSPDPPHSNDPINELVTLAFEAKTGEWFGCSEVGTNKVSGGMGLAFATRLAKVTEGHVWTVTRGSAIHVSSNGTETMDGLYYPGTLIVMRIPETEREIFALRGLVWVDASANRVATVYTSAPLCNRRLT